MSTSSVRIIKNKTDEIRAAVTGKMLKKAVFEGGYVIKNYATLNVEKTFSKKSTGASGLAGSIQVVLDSATETSVSVDVGPTVIYGRIHEFGGIVKPVTAKMLSWVDNGVRIFAKMVQIPARPYMRPAVDEHMDDIVGAIEYQLEQQIKMAAK